MTIGKIGIGLALAVLVSECVMAWTLSVNPLYMEQDTAFDPALLGTWVQKGGDEWQFRRSTRGSYALTVTLTEDAAVFDARLVWLGEALFLDVFPMYLSHLVGGHSVSRIWIRKDIVLLAPLDYAWMKDALDAGAELRALVAAHADDDNAFPITIGLRRKVE